MFIFRLCLASAIAIGPLAALSQSVPPAKGGSTLQVTSRIVYVDVVARDGAGHIVRGLTAKDFRVMEDGRPEKIAFFADHTNDFSEVSAHPGNGLDFSNVGPVSNSVNIVLMDLWNTATQDQPYARKQMIRFLEALPPGHQTALFVLGGRLRMLQNFTGSTDRLVATAKAMKLRPSVTSTTGEQQQESDFVSWLIQAMGRSASPFNASADGLSLQGADEMQRSMDITREALNEIAAAVSGYPGRKNLYWLADKFPLFGGPALEIHELADDVAAFNTRALAPSGDPENLAGLAQPLSPQDIAGANQGLANAQIAVYPILLTGVDASGMGAEARGISNSNQLFTYRSQLHDMMQNLAYTTGGQAFYGTNDFADALRKAFDDGSSYYTLAYIPQNGKWNGAFRKIKVSIAKDSPWAGHEVSLSYRRGYYASGVMATEVNPAQELNAALQPARPESTMLRLRASLVLPDKQNPYLLVKTEVNPEGVDFTTDAHGARHGKLLVLMVALNQGVMQPKQPPQASGVLNLDFTPEQYRAVLKTGIEFALRVKLKPGSYRLRLGVTDMNNHRLGTLDMPVILR